MRRPHLLLLAALVASSVAAAPAGTTADAPAAPAGASLEEGTFPIGVCAWARPVSEDKFCVIVNDPRPWLP